MQTLASGHLAKMKVEHALPVQYQLPLDDHLIDMTSLIGKVVRLEHSGDIHCQHCGRKTSKSFNQGYCFPCFKSLAQCDSCILSPEKCHYDAGTCREPDWADRHCMVDHIVYLANSSGPKVGITRESQVPTRWIDQGATQALPIFRVATRQQSGFVEDLLRQQVPDRTNWRKLLKGEDVSIDLVALRDEIFDHAWPEVVKLQNRFGLQAIEALEDAEMYEFEYPVERYLSKATTHNLDKNPRVEGRLQGIRGQYLLLDTGAINIRKYSAYQVQLSAQLE